MLGGDKLSVSLRRRSRQRSERGAALVEFSIMFLFVIGLIFSIIEFSLYIHDYVIAGRMARDGAATAGTAGSSPSADYSILQSIKSATSGGTSSKIEKIIIYRADPASPKTITPACQNAVYTYGSPSGVTVGTGTGIGSCNVYGPLDLQRPSTDFGCTDSSGNDLVDKKFCPWKNDGGFIKRRDEVNYSTTAGANAGTDLIGVYVKYRHDDLFGFFGTVRLQNTVTVQIEPTSYGDAP